MPHGKSAAKVVEKIRCMPFMTGRREMEFVVVCDVKKLSDDICDELNSVPVVVQHVISAKKKNAADEKLRQVKIPHSG